MRKELLRTARFSVVETVVQHDGRPPVTRAYIEHPGAVVILPLLDDGRVVLIQNRRFAVDETLLELPAGTRVEGEAAAVSAARELIEETGYRAGRLERFTEFFPSPGVLNERMIVFQADQLEHVGQQLEDDEDIEVVTMKTRKIRDLLVAGEFRDAKTMAVLGMYLLRRTPQREAAG